MPWVPSWTRSLRPSPSTSPIAGTVRPGGWGGEPGNMWSWAVAAGLQPLQGKSEALKDSAQWELERGLTLSAMQVHEASVTRSEWFRRATELFQNYDALVLPAAQVWPFDVLRNGEAEQ